MRRALLAGVFSHPRIRLRGVVRRFSPQFLWSLISPALDDALEDEFQKRFCALTFSQRLYQTPNVGGCPPVGSRHA